MQMPEMVIFIVKCVLSLDHFDIDEIEVFDDISVSNFDKPHTQRGLSGGDWQ